MLTRACVLNVPLKVTTSVIDVFFLVAVADIKPAELTVPVPRNAIHDISVSTVLGLMDPSLATTAVNTPRVNSPQPPLVTELGTEIGTCKGTRRARPAAAPAAGQ